MYSTKARHSEPRLSSQAIRDHYEHIAYHSQRKSHHIAVPIKQEIEG